MLHLLDEEPLEVSARGESYMRDGHRGRGVLLPALPVRAAPRTCTCRGWTRTRSAASRSSAPSGWRPSTTWTLERKVTVYDKGFDEDASSLRRVHHPRRATSGAPRSATASRCGSSASTSSSCVRDGSDAALRRRERACAWCACWRRCRTRLDASRREQDAAVRDAARPASSSARTCGSARTSRIGAHVVDPRPGTVVGDGCEIQDDAVLGKPPKLAAPLDGAARAPARRSCSASGAVVCAGAVVFAGARIGAGAIVGDQAFVRERARDRRGQRDRARQRASTTTCTVGARVQRPDRRLPDRLRVVEDDVFVGPGADARPTTRRWRRHGAGLPARGRDCCGAPAGSAAASCSRPAVEVGEEAFVAAGRRGRRATCRRGRW